MFSDPLIYSLLSLLPIALASESLPTGSTTVEIVRHHHENNSSTNQVYNNTGPSFANGTSGGAGPTGIGYTGPTGTASFPNSENRTFGIVALSEGVFSYTPVNARNGSIMIGLPPATSCPDSPVYKCPAASNETVYTGGFGVLDLSVAVPGGQRVYVSPIGALEFTPAHSHAIQSGAGFGGFSVSRDGELQYRGRYGRGFKTCPAAEGGYLVFAGGRHGNSTAQGAAEPSAQRMEDTMTRDGVEGEMVYGEAKRSSLDNGKPAAGDQALDKCEPVRLMTIDMGGPGAWQYE